MICTFAVLSAHNISCLPTICATSNLILAISNGENFRTVSHMLSKNDWRSSVGRCDKKSLAFGRFANISRKMSLVSLDTICECLRFFDDGFRDDGEPTVDVEYDPMRDKVSSSYSSIGRSGVLFLESSPPPPVADVDAMACGNDDVVLKTRKQNALKFRYRKMNIKNLTIYSKSMFAKEMKAIHLFWWQ